MLSRVFSPYVFNPLNINPMKRVLEDRVDIEAPQGSDAIKLFITATHTSAPGESVPLPRSHA